jgi:diaminopropionate ammonia-lyase
VNPEQVLVNPLFDPTFRAARGSMAALEVHRKLPGYAPSPLIELPTVAAALEIERVWLKDESRRMGLPAFKILGASWAVIATIQEMLEIGIDQWQTIDDLRALAEPLRPLTLACATDGNHGRAVAKMAAWLGFGAIVLVPADMAAARIEAIRGEGAEVRVIEGSYDDAVDASARLASERCLVISDTAWPGYEEMPRRVIEGYGTIMAELDDELAGAAADLVAVPIGVGALAAAVVGHLRSTGQVNRPSILGIEAVGAACMLESARAGQPVRIPGPHTSIMSGLNCGVPSPLAWPVVSRGANRFVSVSDDRVRQAMRMLAEAGVVAGECGAAGLAGLLLLRDRGELGVTSSALLISTEGATDPTEYERIVGQIASC